MGREKAKCKARMAFVEALPWCEEQSLLKKNKKKLKTMQLRLPLAHVNNEPLKKDLICLFPDQMNTPDLLLDPLFPWRARVKSNIVL